MLQALLFDLDNTLIDRDGAFLQCVRENFSDPLRQTRLLQLDRGGHGDRQALFEGWQELSGQAIDQAMLGRMLARHIRPDPELLRVLEALSQRVKVAIVSNGGGHTQRLKARAAGLDQVIPALYISSEVGLEKPDPNFLWLVCRELDVLPCQCLMVGDQLEIDGAGARAAGMAFSQVTSVLSGPRLARLMAEHW
ncbi:HAD family hydrolase [bacterium]|nr:HAD family hydrolase [bacterium]